MLRYSILTHTHPHWHWDLLIDPDGEGLLRTWRLAKTPDDPAQQGAEELPRHRRIYLEYEGPVSGNRGEVAQWDQGEYHLLEQAKGILRIHCQGRQISGEIELRQASETDWTYQYLPGIPPPALS